MKPLLDIRNLSISFKTYRGIMEAIHGVSMTVAPAETVGIVGESGCGKSVTAHAVMRLLPQETAIYSSGTIYWDGQDIQALSENQMNELRGRDMAMVFQDPMTALNPVLTIGSQIREGLRLHGSVPAGQEETQALALLQAVGITSPEKRIHQYPHELSGGMRQRCLIAMALACSPKLLFADEPTTALDVTTEAQVLELLSQLQKKSAMAVVLISHNLGVIARMCHRVYVMYAGVVVEQGTTEELFDGPAHPYTQGLLASLPDPDHGDKELQGIPGQAPDLFHLTAGCRFYPRCPRAMHICTREEPPAYTLSDTHNVRCWLWCPERRNMT